MTLEIHKYLIQPVLVERVGGRTVREVPGVTLTVFGPEQIVETITQYEAELAEWNIEHDGGDSAEDQLRHARLSRKLSRPG